MLTTVIPDYYNDFTCLAGRCTHCCCIGWEIDIDDDTYAGYLSLDGPDADLVRSAVSDSDPRHFILNENGRCPLLNESGLCRLCLDHGEESLCTVCHMYPRFAFLYNTTTEYTLSMACEEAARIIITRPEPVKLLRTAAPGRTDENDCDDEPFCPDDIENVRDTAVRILQDRSADIRVRICAFLDYCSDVQSLINSEEEFPGTLHGGLPALSARYTGIPKAPRNMTHLSPSSLFTLFHDRLESLSGMEILGTEWDSVISAVKVQLGTSGADTYAAYLSDFSGYMSGRTAESEQLLVYFTDRYFMKSVYDCDLLGKARLAVLSFLTIRDIGAARFISGGRSFTTDDHIDICRIYSGEVEHSEDNLDYLSEEFVFNHIYDIDSMCGQVYI
jgi:lysine-N-methylase